MAHNPPTTLACTAGTQLSNAGDYFAKPVCNPSEEVLITFDMIEEFQLYKDAVDSAFQSMAGLRTFLENKGYI